MAIQLNPPPPRHKLRLHDWDRITGCGIIKLLQIAKISVLGSKKPDVAINNAVTEDSASNDLSFSFEAPPLPPPFPGTIIGGKG